jgi:hypothetical protein
VTTIKVTCLVQELFQNQILGFTNHVLDSLLPFGKIFRMDISTTLSFATLTPVVSKSKKHKGRVSESSILNCVRFGPVINTLL